MPDALSPSDSTEVALHDSQNEGIKSMVIIKCKEVCATDVLYLVTRAAVIILWVNN